MAPVDASPHVDRMNPPPWGDGPGASPIESTMRGWLLQTFNASDDPAVELALWDAPVDDKGNLSQWLAWWALHRPAFLAAKVAGYTIHGAEQIQAVNAITKDEAAGHPPLVTLLANVKGVRQDAVRYEWHGLEPLMFLRAPWVSGLGAPDLWKQIDTWPNDPPAPIPAEAEPTDEIFNGPASLAGPTAGGTSPPAASTIAGPEVDSPPPEAPKGPAITQTTVGPKGEETVDLPCPKCSATITVPCGAEAVFPREKRCPACNGWITLVRKGGVASIEGNPLAAAMPAPAPMPADWFGKDPPKEKKKRASKARPASDHEPEGP